MLGDRSDKHQAQEDNNRSIGALFCPAAPGARVVLLLRHGTRIAPAPMGSMSGKFPDRTYRCIATEGASPHLKSKLPAEMTRLTDAMSLGGLR